MVPILVVFGVFLLFAIFYAILTYNGLVAKKTRWKMCSPARMRC